MYPTSFVKTLFVLSVAALLLPQAMRAVECTEKPNHPQCEPGSEGQPVTPARITFADAVDHEIQSDGGVYEHSGVIDGLEVFIGSQANFGNIFLRPNSSCRKLNFTVPANGCGLPAGTFDFGFLKADVNDVVSDGVFGMAEGDVVTAPMRIRFFDAAGQAYFLSFQPSQPGPCRNKSGLVKVERAADGLSRTVSDDGSACIEKSGTKGSKAELCIGPVEMNFSFDLEALP
jgi:hypothetical protein